MSSCFSNNPHNKGWYSPANNPNNQVFVLKILKYYVIPKGQKCVRYPQIVDSSELYRLLYGKNPIKLEIFFAYQLLIATIPIEFLASKNLPYSFRSGVFFLLEEVDCFGFLYVSAPGPVSRGWIWKLTNINIMLEVRQKP